MAPLIGHKICVPLRNLRTKNRCRWYNRQYALIVANEDSQRGATLCRAGRFIRRLNTHCHRFPDAEHLGRTEGREREMVFCGFGTCVAPLIGHKICVPLRNLRTHGMGIRKAAVTHAMEPQMNPDENRFDGSIFNALREIWFSIPNLCSSACICGHQPNRSGSG